MKHVTVVQELGQPSLTIDIDRAKIARYGINVADINGLIEAAVGGAAATQVAQGERLFDLVVRLLAAVSRDAGADRQRARGDGGRPARAAARAGGHQAANGASFIYRQDNSRFIGVQYSVEGRDLASAVQEAQRKVAAAVPLPPGYRVVWGGEYEEYTASRAQLQLILPVTLTLIFVILFALYNNFKFPFITVAGVVLSAPIGGLLALELSGTPFSVSSGIGFLALFGVSVQTAIVYISYVNELRRTGMSIERGDVGGGAAEATADHDDGARRRVRPAAGGVVEWRGVGLAAAVRARDRGRAVLPAADQRVPDAGAVSRWRRGKETGSRSKPVI